MGRHDLLRLLGAKMPFPGCLLLSALRPFRGHQPVADKLTGKISARRPARLCWQDLGRWLDLSHIKILYSCSQCLSWCFWMVGSTASMSPGLIRVPAMSESHGVTAVRHQLILQHLLASCTVLEGCRSRHPSGKHCPADAFAGVQWCTLASSGRRPTP